MIAYRWAVATVFPWSSRVRDRRLDGQKQLKRLRLLQVKRMRPEVDDPVMSIQDLAAK